MLKVTTFFRRRAVLIAAVLSAVVVRGALAATPEEIETALQKGKAFLYSKQRKEIWDNRNTPPSDEDIKKNPGGMSEGQWGELTALSTFALLSAGESPQAEKLAPAMKFLLSNDFKGVYAAGAKAEIYPLLPPTDDLKRLASKDARRLTGARFREGTAKGHYDLLLESDRNTRFDHAVSLFGVLGVVACEKIPGVEVSTNDYWKPVEEAWIRDQDPSGAWAVGKKPSEKNPLSASMTAGGLAVLFVAQDRLHADMGVGCRGNITSPPIEKGLQWLGQNFESTVLSDKTQRYAPFSTLYDVERVGMASGRKYLGTTNWYEFGADYLVKHQETNGSWSKGQVPATCYALLFLSHGRAPVVFNKLQYNVAGVEGNWNQRPRDVANVVDNMGRVIERDLNWQIVNLSAPMDELHEAPILYMSGNQSLQFTAEEEAKLKQFCEEGGIIYGNADCGHPDFASSFRKLGAKLFPDYEFRELPAEHPIYTNQQYMRSSWKTPPQLLALSNGVREMMIIPADPAKRAEGKSADAKLADLAQWWQQAAVSGHEEAFQLAANLFLYSAGKQNLLERGRTYLVGEDSKANATRPVKVGRLQYDGNWDPEPAGWRRMATILRNAGDRLEIFPIKLGGNKLGNGRGVGVHVAHLTGTNKFKFNDAIRAEIKAFVEGGGTLIVDAAGGAGEFAEAAEAELASMFGAGVASQLKQPLTPAHPIYNLPGGKIEDFGYRPYTRKIVGSLHGPQIKAIKAGDRQGVFYSREDLSGGLVGSSTDGVIGYDPKTATALMRNLILFGALGEKASLTETAMAATVAAPAAPGNPAVPGDAPPKKAPTTKKSTATTKKAK